MLDTQTKRRIDDCRDILVGKLPDPKAQIEQITIGLIYKFMDDMDKEAVELGGQAKFFSDYKVPDPEFPNDRSKDKVIEFSQYAWDKLMHPKVTASEMLTLYSEAIQGMEKNPNIPQLFRDIFNNAYLPYRDPETLKLFLKTIGEFEYTHSEKLGDAFEYLLSVMGSQGDAGQFRTPRHIIDFLVAIIDPDKTETILDPACGTAGFLISAYKHILLKYTRSRTRTDNACVVLIECGRDRARGRDNACIVPTVTNIYQYNQLPDDQKFPLAGDSLTPDDRKKLIQNFVGYDISPDMVRLSLVNLYLHGFNTPNIHEYDTLSSEERWNENFDVVLANPPFMTPKGGIRPHKKFGVQANKAEVLFTDYIAEHLNSNGRAGIVVPNGIVATSQTAYKQLRKMLVQDSLIAVISLPAGVFQPYSGVKTSILILDKRLAKKSQHILFFKIENDGFDLGAQRREINKNDLPLALQTLEAYKECLSNDKAFEDLPSLATLVEKEIVLGNKDVVLNADRYFEKEASQTEFELVKLDEVCEFKRGPFGGSLKKEIFVPDGYLVYEQYHAINDDFNFGRYFIDETKFQEMIGFEVKPSDLLISCSGTMGRIAIVPENAKRGIINQALLKLTLDQNRILPLYLKKILEAEEVQERHFRNQEGAAIQNVASVKVLKEIEIPLPPLSIQQQIVAEIEGFQKIIDGAKQVVNHYKPTITINPDWEMVKLGEVTTILGDGLHGTPSYTSDGEYYFINGNNLIDGKIEFKGGTKRVNKTEYDKYKKNLNDRTLLVSINGTLGNIAFYNGEKIILGKSACYFNLKENIDKRYVRFILSTPYFHSERI
jgi:type I restriction enzyme M protein